MFYIPARTTVRQRLAHTARRIALAAAVRVLDHLDATTAAPATDTETAPATTPALFGVEELPPIEAIEAAADVHERAADLARQADRSKRKARKLLDRIPVGIYGRATVERIESARQTPDLDRIRADYARAGLGDVPMRSCAPTLRVTLAPAVEADATSTDIDALAVAA